MTTPDVQSKFWGARSDSSSSEGSDSDDSENSSSSDSESVKATAKKMAAPTRWADVGDSSDEEDERRVVRSAKDKQWTNLQQIIKTMNNQKKIGDFSQVQAGFESLLKAIAKAKNLMEKEGLPAFVIRALAELEAYVNTQFADKIWLKKLSKPKAIAFNSLRAKIRKSLEDFREKIDAFNLNPRMFANEEKEIDSLESSSSSSSSSISSDSSSESEGDSETKKSEFSDDEDDDEWGASSSEEDQVQEVERTDIHEQGLARWGKKEETTKKKGQKVQKEKGPRVVRETKLQLETTLTGRHKDVSILLPGEKIDAELLTKKLGEVTALRGRKGFDRGEQIRHLHELCTAAQSVGPKSVLEMLGHLISAYFDANLGAFISMPQVQWVLCYEQIDAALTILRKEKDVYFPFVVTEEDEDISVTEGEPDNLTTAALLKVQQNDEGVTKEYRAKISTALMLTNFLERLDDELTKSLQLIEIHSEEYKIRLGQTVDMLALLWKSYLYFNDTTTTEQKNCSQNISLRLLEHLYYKDDGISTRFWDLVKKRLNQKDADALVGDYAPNKIVQTFVRQNLMGDVDLKIKVRVILYAAYYESLRGRFHSARDLLQTANIQELASQCNISTQILFNRNLVQLGLAAFRLGLINEAHNYLSEVCAMGRYKELLAQGLSNPRGIEKSADQEKLEKRRLLPYHMHIASDLVEAVHNICAMLLEVPYMAANTFDLSKKPIARNFRRLLEVYDRQAFTGPPENPRETVMAATKALQKGNWKVCSDLIASLKIWSSFNNSEKVKEILTSQIKQEALRTYLFSYSSLYESFSIKQLSDMFSLPISTAHSIVSKMMIQGALSGSWDETSENVLINRVDRTALQVLALQLTEKIAQSVDQNETMSNYRNPKYVLVQANQRDDRAGRRYDDRWTDRSKWNNNEQQQQQYERNNFSNFGFRSSAGGQPFAQSRTGNRPTTTTTAAAVGSQQRRRW